MIPNSAILTVELSWHSKKWQETSQCRFWPHKNSDCIPGGSGGWWLFGRGRPHRMGKAYSVCLTFKMDASLIPPGTGMEPVPLASIWKTYSSLMNEASTWDCVLSSLTTLLLGSHWPMCVLHLFTFKYSN